MGTEGIARASKTFDGYAYFLAGVESGNLCGTSPMDPAKISDKLDRYVEGGAPRWSPHYVEADGRSALVLVAEGPKLGDPICTLQKSFEGFLREASSSVNTEAAGPADVSGYSRQLKGSLPCIANSSPPARVPVASII